MESQLNESASNRNFKQDIQQAQGENIKVAVRLRPFTTREEARSCERIIDIEQNTVAIKKPRNNQQQLDSVRKFTFDYAYWSHDGFKKTDAGINVADFDHPNGSLYIDQQKVFKDLGEFLLDNALKGYNSALLAYGQTGSGKSYSVSGYGLNVGIIPRFARGLFESLEKKRIENQQQDNSAIESKKDKYQVYFSMIEIYNEIVRDLLASHLSDLLLTNQSTASSSLMISRGLKVREHPKQGFFVANLTSHLCTSHKDIEAKIDKGQMNKTIVATNMNETSSRGHTIYEFTIKQASTATNDAITSVVQIVDLAGNERVSVQVNQTPNHLKQKSYRSPAATADYKNKLRQNANSLSANNSMSSNAHSFARHQNQRFKESISINQSLSALGNCIQVLSQYSQQLETNLNNSCKKNQKTKIPYRDSVLTKLLNKCCLSGNSKVVIMATVSPADVHYDDTLSTLRFADRAKQIKTHATINRDLFVQTRANDEHILDALSRENKRLKKIVEDGNRHSFIQSDDSSQTSNFDESESMNENFSVIQTSPKKIATSSNNISPLRTRKNSKHASKAKNTNVVETHQQIGQIVGAANEKSKIIKDGKIRHIGKPSNNKMHDDGWIDSDENSEYDIENFDETLEEEDSQGTNSKTMTSTDSEDSFAALEGEDVSEKEKIEILNKLLSNTRILDKLNNDKQRVTNSKQRNAQNTNTNLKRPRVPAARRLSMITGDLKNSHPYLSNLNQDEQLTGKISYLIKIGETIIGRDENCDIVLHGPEIRPRHAKVTRVLQKKSTKDSTISIEPILDNVVNSKKQNSALMVNGCKVDEKTTLNHCDRVLIGTNSYFVFMDNVSLMNSSNSTIANRDMITFETARAEVARNMIEKDKNGEQVLNEINNYQHRPGTGKYRGKMNEKNDKRSTMSAIDRHETINNNQENIYVKAKVNDGQVKSDNTSSNPEDLDAIYKDQLMVDTYELTLPVAEANAIARELGIKVTYSMKILTGEERPINETLLSNYATDLESNASEPQNSSSAVDTIQRKEGVDDGGVLDSVENILRPKALSSLDIPPEVYIKVHVEEFGFSFYWTQNKFRARHSKMFELYGVWDNGGKMALIEYLIEQTRAFGRYVEDPFVDDPLHNFVLFGHSQIVLQPISHFIDIQNDFDILDLEDSVIGSIKIRAIPCKEVKIKASAIGKQSFKSSYRYEPYTDSELSARFIDDPKKLLGKKLAIELNIISCSNFPKKYCNIYCQYSLDRDQSFVRTPLLRPLYHRHHQPKQNADTREIDSASTMNSTNFAYYSTILPQEQTTNVEEFFNYKHYIVFDSVNQDVLDFIQHGFLTIQVVGQYYHPTNKPLTVISVIIRSIDKFMNDVDQQQKQQIESTVGYNVDYMSGNNSDSVATTSTNNYYSRSQANNESIQQSGASSVVSADNLHKRRFETDEEGTIDENGVDDQLDSDEDNDDNMEMLKGGAQEGVIDMILTKRKLDRAENQLHYLRQTVNLAEQNNKKNISIRTMKRLLSFYGQGPEGSSFDEATNDVTTKEQTSSKNSGCHVM